MVMTNLGTECNSEYRVIGRLSYLTNTISLRVTSLTGNSNIITNDKNTIIIVVHSVNYVHHSSFSCINMVAYRPSLSNSSDMIYVD